ncbi:odorant receptor 94a-like [Cardiocondyla obscurior]|uniref:odorant receptor 94a-like n=1 Tax=Cardiocondyla obscurior TaxID=286306 RepID=UPI0039656636
MPILQYTFKLLTICGCWRPDSWSSLNKRIAYYIYSVIIVLSMYTFMLTQLMDMILIVDNADDFSDNFFILIAMFLTCCKVLVVLVNRNNIVKLIDILMEKPCRPIRSSEIKILYKFDKNIQINTQRFVYLGLVTFLCILLSSLSTNFRNKKLTYRAWLPFDYSSTLLFFLTYTHQMVGLLTAAFLSIGCDTLICGLLVHICCQIEILLYRLRKIISYSDIFRDCVRQHHRICRLALIVNAKFRLTITMQFIISTLVVCFSLYQINKTTRKDKYVEMILYMACMLTQIFFYCWYGNELKIKSHQMIDNIFGMEWLSLDKDKKQSLMIIMRRTLVPIQITCAYIFPMNLSSFMSVSINVIKTDAAKIFFFFFPDIIEYTLMEGFTIN